MMNLSGPRLYKYIYVCVCVYVPVLEKEAIKLAPSPRFHIPEDYNAKLPWKFEDFYYFIHRFFLWVFWQEKRLSTYL